MNEHFYRVGCYGDGAAGHQHTRERCAAMVEDVLQHRKPKLSVSDIHTAYELARLLRGDMSDDAGEEYDACDWLNAHAVNVDGAYWAWNNGDFGLWPEEGE